ncbi:MAG TPA: hypothetical protein VG943_15300 [Caulobacterales bacterium]|nr:hypothetical protein [Caulobacterales bacterium]
MNARLLPLATLVFGVVTLLITLAFPQLPSVRVAHFAQGDFSAALNAFQRAATPADLAAVFGAPPDLTILDAMTAGNRLDLFAFIPSYTLFLACAALTVAGGLKRRLAWLTLALLAIALAGDVIETSTQLAITADYARARTHLPVAPWCWTKFIGLGAYSWAIALASLGERKRYVLALLNLPPLPATLAAFFGLTPSMQGASLAFAAAWIALLVIAALELLRKDRRESTSA